MKTNPRTNKTIRLLNTMRPIRYLFLSVFLTYSVLNNAQAESFSQTMEYQQIHEVWKTFINYEPQKPLLINYFINREIERYAEQRGNLWPENQKLVEEQLDVLRSQLRSNPTIGLGQSYYYPYKGIAPFTAAGFRKYYDITFGLKHKVQKQAFKMIDEK